MLKGQGKHLSFHTPGHKEKGEDITELSYSDNLSSPRGAIALAEQEIAQILGAERSYILTDGSTAGVYAMLFALARSGVKKIAFSARSHPSVLRGCELAGLQPILIFTNTAEGIPLQPSAEQAEEGLKEADALLLTSPDYYGNFPDLEGMKALCACAKKPLVIDGAHGAHLHFGALHAGKFACMWVDGAHKSLPANTQGAVVSANGEWARRLGEAVSYFRTSSPSYPIMASVEYAVKYPRNERLEAYSEAFKERVGAVKNADWSKILVGFGRECDGAQAALEKRGIYPEFNDGNYLMFYLSPATKIRWLRRLEGALKHLPRGEIFSLDGERTLAFGEEEEIALSQAAGRVCARDCGLFPPCVPLVLRGEIFTQEKIETLQKAKGSFGVFDGGVSVFKE